MAAAFLAGTLAAGAFLAGAFLAGAFLAAAFLAGAFFATALLWAAVFFLVLAVSLSLFAPAFLVGIVEFPDNRWGPRAVVGSNFFRTARFRAREGTRFTRALLALIA